jgi:hypothetical protein
MSLRQLLVCTSIAAVSAVSLTACGNPNTITSSQALQQASRAFVCPPGFTVAFESDEGDLKKIQKAFGTSQKMFNDIDCGKEASVVDKALDIKAILPFVSKEVNNGVVFVDGSGRAMAYRDPAGRASFEPIRIKADPSLDEYFKAQGFQRTSKAATKDVNGQEWNLYDVKTPGHVKTQYKFDKLTPPAMN